MAALAFQGAIFILFVSVPYFPDEPPLQPSQKMPFGQSNTQSRCIFSFLWIIYALIRNSHSASLSTYS